MHGDRPGEKHVQPKGNACHFSKKKLCGILIAPICLARQNSARQGGRNHSAARARRRAARSESFTRLVSVGSFLPKTETLT